MLAASPANSAHERIGRYEVLRKIATGGMAELFLAKQVGMEGFEKLVAIKRILSHLAYDEEFINMFRDEARIVAKLSHPNIVQIYDLGKSDETYFIAMEYIPGRNLSSIAKKAKAKGEAVPPAYIARCVAQACEGLYYAHTRKDIDGQPLRIVHRDVSPQNIIVSFSGSVKLVDFGIAKAATKIAHTRAGVLKGKYAYMSPEQIRGEDTDARSDLFAVGIVLYELLCGRRPFEKDNSIQTLKAIVQDAQVDCRVHNPQIPDSLAAIIDKALSKDPNQRYQTAQEIQLVLEDFVQAGPLRCNNVTISTWVSELFEEELSRERGGTMVFQGIGEVILPDVDDKVEEAGPKGEPSPMPMPAGVRAGGSADSRPPPQAPSNAMLAKRPDSISSSGGRRGKMLEEGVIERDDGGWDDDATVHGIDAVKAPEDITVPPVSQSTPSFHDDATEFAKKEMFKKALEASQAIDVAKKAEEEEALSEDFDEDSESTVSPEQQEEEAAPEPEVQSGAEELEASDDDVLGPLEDSTSGEEDNDPWDEATLGYPDGVAPLDQAADDDEDEAPLVAKRALPPPAETRPHQTLGGGAELAELGFGVESTDSKSDADLWDESTSSSAASVEDDRLSGPVVLDSPDVEVSGKLDLAGFDMEPSQETEGVDSTLAQSALSLADPTIAQPSLDDLGSDDEEEEAPAEPFNDDRTLGAVPGVISAFGRADTGDFLDDDTGALPREDSGASKGDVTIAYGQQALAGDDDDDGTPDLSQGTDELDATVGGDDGPALPTTARGPRPIENDARTMAGNSVDYLAAGVNPPRGGLYDQEAPEPKGFEIEIDTSPRGPAPKRGQQSLASLKLAKAEVKVPTIEGPAFDAEETQGEDGLDASGEHGMPGDSVGVQGMELGLDDDFSQRPVQPTPLEDPDEPHLPSPPPKDRRNLSIGPRIPVPLNPPVPMTGPMGIGSTNVPPAALSLSEVLHQPHRAKASGMMVLPKNQPGAGPVAAGRGPSVLGRQIREVATRPGDVSVARGGARATPTPGPAMLLDPMMAPESSYDGSAVAVVPVKGRSSGELGKKVFLGVIGLIIAGALATLLYLALPRLLGPSEPHLTIKTTPAGARVFVDGVLQQGLTPLNITGLKAGTQYEIRLEGDGLEPASQTVVVPANRPLIWQIALKPVGTTPGATPH